MNSENFEEIFQLMKDDITKEKTAKGNPTPLVTCSHSKE